MRELKSILTVKVEREGSDDIGRGQGDDIISGRSQRRRRRAASFIRQRGERRDECEERDTDIKQQKKKTDGFI